MNHHDGMEPIFFTPPSGSMQRRILYKGGKGGGGNNDEMMQLMREQQAQLARQAAEAAARQPDRQIVESAANYPAEQERLKEAARQQFYAGTGYNDPAQQAAREKQYSQMSTDVVDYHRTKLDRERDEALRQLGFNLARSGLSGSSQDAYDREQVQRKYLEGVTDINSKAANATAQSKSGFEAAISRGLQAINSGGDAATQISSALQEKANTMQQALEAAKGATWGGFFSDLASTADTAKIKAQQGLVKNAVAAPDDALLSGKKATGATNTGSRLF